MTERDIAGHVSALKGALKADDEDLGISAMMVLLETALIDLHRIADALVGIEMNTRHS